MTDEKDEVVLEELEADKILNDAIEKHIAEFGFDPTDTDARVPVFSKRMLGLLGRRAPRDRARRLINKKGSSWNRVGEFRV